jgi:hypothetical protein
MNRFQRVPQRTEKEPMRQIYMYYKRLKQYIQRAGPTSKPGERKQSTEPVLQQVGHAKTQLTGGAIGQRSNSVGAASGDLNLSKGNNSSV